MDPANNGRETTAIFGLLAPEFGEHFLSPNLQVYVEAFLGAELQLGYVHLRCADSEYDSGWHRDLGGVRTDMTYEGEMAMLNRPMKAMRWQVAFADEPCLWLVPHSQRRYRTEEERKALYQDRHMDITGQTNLFLRRGQALIWDGSTLHRGKKPPEMKERVVMAGGLAKYEADAPAVKQIDERFRWRMNDNIGPALPDQVRLWWERWQATQPEG